MTRTAGTYVTGAAALTQPSNATVVKMLNLLSVEHRHPKAKAAKAAKAGATASESQISQR